MELKSCEAKPFASIAEVEDFFKCILSKTDGDKAGAICSEWSSSSPSLEWLLCHHLQDEGDFTGVLRIKSATADCINTLRNRKSLFQRCRRRKHTQQGELCAAKQPEMALQARAASETAEGPSKRRRTN